METNIKTILGKLFSSESNVFVIVGNDPIHRKYKNPDTSASKKITQAYRLVVMRAEVVEQKDWSIMIRTPFHLPMDNATMITYDFLFYSTTECITSQCNTILYFKDFIGQYLLMNEISKPNVFVTCWVNDRILEYFHDPYTRDQYWKNNKVQWFITNETIDNES